MIKVTTCENDTIDITNYAKGLRVEVALKAIKEYKYCEILGRTIPIHFREVFQRKDYYFIAAEDNEPQLFTTWASVEIK